MKSLNILTSLKLWASKVQFTFQNRSWWVWRKYMVSELFCHVKSMLTFTLPLAKPRECIKSCIHSRSIFQAPFFLSLPSCAELERETCMSRDSGEAHPAKKHWNQGELTLGGIRKVLGSSVWFCKVQTHTSFNWRWRCFTVLIYSQRQRTPGSCELSFQRKRRQMEEGWWLENPYATPYSPAPTDDSPNARLFYF